MGYNFNFQTGKVTAVEEQVELPFPWRPNEGFRDSFHGWCRNCQKYRWFHSFTNNFRQANLCDVCHAEELTGEVVTGDVTDKRL
jgi:hypothetical protein